MKSIFHLNRKPWFVLWLCHTQNRQFDTSLDRPLLGNPFVSAINANIHANVSVQDLAIYGIVFTFGIIPIVLVIL